MRAITTHAARVRCRRIEQLRAADDLVGSLFATLDATGQATRTIVCLGSDNGLLEGDHGLNQKLWLYERSIRVPFACSGPTIPARHSQAALSDADVAEVFFTVR